jgi:hypothetical protein
VAPKITMVHGCATVRVDKPSRNGFVSDWAAARFIAVRKLRNFAPIR